MDQDPKEGRPFRDRTEWLPHRQGASPHAGKNERRAEVQAILVKVARAEDKLNALATTLQEIAEVDALLSEERPLTADEEGRISHNLQARLQGANDDDERALILEALASLPTTVQQGMDDARNALRNGGDQNKAAATLGTQHVRAMKILTTYRSAQGGAKDVLDVTGDGRDREYLDRPARERGQARGRPAG